MNTSMSYAVFLEPRGALKILQFIFVICAFACTCDFRGRVVLSVSCHVDNTTEVTTTPTTTTSTTTTTTSTTSSSTSSSTTSSTTTPPTTTTTATKEDETEEPQREASSEFTTSFMYPFNLEKSSVTETGCNGTDQVMSLSGNYTSTASFYVFVGVMGMLFSLFALIVYVFFQPTYEFMEWIPVADTVIHGIFTLMWFGSAIAWATALSQIKKHTKCDGVIENNPDICDIGDTCSCSGNIEYQLLDFSVIFGFLNVLLYGANVWFVFKETKFFKKPVTS